MVLDHTRQPIKYKETVYGFKYGAAEFTRVASDERLGWVIVELKTQKKTIQLYVTKTGKVRIHDEDGEWFSIK